VLASDIAAHREIAALAPGAIELVALDAPPGTVAEHLGRALAAGRPAEPAPMPGWDDVAARTAAVYDQVAG
jgi:hypothetical protein